MASSLAASLVLLLLASPAQAQLLPDRPVTWLGGRLVLGGSVSVSAATTEHDTYFNTGTYSEDTMRLVTAAVTSSLEIHPRVGVEADLRVAGEADGSYWYFRPRGLLVRLQPLATPHLTLAAGLIQTAFGTAGARDAYGPGNLLIGRPLIYQYATPIRGDALPRNVPELLQNRGLGAEAHYFIGDSITYEGDQDYTYVGLPLADPTGWNAGVRLTAGRERVNATVTLTDGSLSNPRSRGTPGGWQASGRLETHVVTGLVLGASAAHGRYLLRELVDAVETRAVAFREPRETAVGVDLEYSRDYWLLRAEAIHNRRSVPGFREPLVREALSVTGLDVEGRYRLAPGLYAAARFGSIFFGPAAAAGDGETWDANVFRMEAGAGWSVTRGVLLKAAYQYNRRDMTGDLRSAHRVGVEATAWF